MNTRYNGVLSAYNTHRKTCDSVGIPYSTDTALLRVVNDILSYMNKQHVPILVLLDLSAAFDTVDHAILLRQVKTSFGITDTALAWFSSYLSGRSQCMSVNGERLDCYPLPFGVRQGSCLGPLLFSAYASKLFEVIKLYSRRGNYHIVRYLQPFQKGRFLSMLSVKISALECAPPGSQ